MAAADEVQENTDEKDPPVAVEHALKENKIKLEDLKVSELKSELENRSLDKNGIKSALVERLKTAMIEEGKNPEEYNFEISSESDCKVSEEVETIDTNGITDCNDKLNINEEKQEAALQLSIDDEEAQLNEESLIEIAKQPDIENNKVDDSEQVGKEVSASEKSIIIEQSTTPKAENETKKQKENIKTPVISKNVESSSAVLNKVLKLVVKNDKLKSPTVLAKSIWITGLANATRAADLKVLFSKQGRVLSVKIVKSAKEKPGKCYGFVTMASGKDATKAIQNLHCTELNGCVISVELKQNAPSTLIKKADSKVLTSTAKKVTLKKEVSAPKKQVTSVKKSTVTESKDSSKSESKIGEKKISSESSGKKNEKTSTSDKSKDRKPREHKEKDKDTLRSARRPASTRPRTYGYDKSRYSTFRRPFGRRPFSSQVGIGSNYSRPRSSLFSLQRIREERFQRERFREKREAERRRLDELTRHRYIERKQREEAYRLEREKERLRIERELLERERAEIIKLEREKQRLERERLERERDELRHQVEMRRSAIKRPFSRVDRDPDPLWNDRKKPASRYNVRPSMHPEPPTTSRFNFPSRERTITSLPSRERSSLPIRDRASFGREYDRHQDRFTSQKRLEVLPRSDFSDRDNCREITIRTRDERQIFSRNDFRDRDNRRSLTSREPERSSASRREVPRNDWKQDRRVHERGPTSSSSGHRRLNYY